MLDDLAFILRRRRIGLGPSIYGHGTIRVLLICISALQLPFVLIPVVARQAQLHEEVVDLRALLAQHFLADQPDHVLLLIEVQRALKHRILVVDGIGALIHELKVR
jgi:hypothetical protein